MKYASRAKKTKVGHWQIFENRRATVESLRKTFNVRILDDWYDVSQEDFANSGGHGVLKPFNGSLQALLVDVYPERTWFAWRFKNVPQHFWKKHSNHVEFVNYIAKPLNVRQPNDWYNVSRVDFCRHGGSSILRYHQYSLANLLQTVYPQENWKIWKFSNASILGYWDKVENRLEFARQLEHELKIKKPYDWYNISSQILKDIGAFWVIEKHFGGLIRRFLWFIYPDHYWLKHKMIDAIQHYKGIIPFRFQADKQGYWQSVHNRKIFLLAVEEDLRIYCFPDWYDITSPQLREYGGTSLLGHYGGSMIKMLQRVYPEYRWDPSKLAHLPRNYWKSEKISKFLTRAEGSLKIQSPSEWYRISSLQISGVGGRSVFSYWHNALFSKYPNTKWQKTQLSRPDKRSEQRRLLHVMKDIFPKYDVIEEHFIGASMQTSTGQISLDVYVPQLQLAVEYQGTQHYTDIPGRFGITILQGARDMEKKTLCKSYGITIVNIPYWWKGDKESVMATIHYHRPDIQVDVHPGMMPLINPEGGSRVQLMQPEHFQGTALIPQA